MSCDELDTASHRVHHWDRKHSSFIIFLYVYNDFTLYIQLLTSMIPVIPYTAVLYGTVPETCCDERPSKCSGKIRESRYGILSVPTQHTSQLRCPEKGTSARGIRFAHDCTLVVNATSLERYQCHISKSSKRFTHGHTPVSLMPKPARSAFLGTPNHSIMSENTMAVFAGTASPPEINTRVSRRSSDSLVGTEAAASRQICARRLGLKL